ncbi:hypothetical protein AGOR_G00071310 [Albula goreensis]|uniref:Uncharacterized protein n=1 Tax=Albula goreensis TaxID=1534307 RepID=A0A8T3DLI9_9TELE|nr:hypothetical protein AGOR_G00071310 [Albula goreensis]
MDRPGKVKRGERIERKDGFCRKSYQACSDHLISHYLHNLLLWSPLNPALRGTLMVTSSAVASYMPSKHLVKW